jgi:hypothetical protein
MSSNLENIVQTHNLPHCDEPFSTEEVENVIKEMPSDRAPGLDGFNRLYLKKY